MGGTSAIIDQSVGTRAVAAAAAAASHMKQIDDNDDQNYGNGNEILNTEKHVKSLSITQRNKDEGTTPPPPYTLRDHCHYLKLRTICTTQKSYWYCDWTSHFASSPTINFRGNTSLMKNVIQDYCQPFSSLAELDDDYVGFAPLSPNTEDPLAIRTVSIKLRPDASHYLILQAVHQSFTALHQSQYHIVASTPQTFQAIGANGSAPYFVSAFVTVHKQSLVRQLWIRFYHVESVPLCVIEEEEQDEIMPSKKPMSDHNRHATAIQNLLEKVHSKTNPSQETMAPLRNKLTPINTQLAEACVLVQFVIDGELSPSFACPEHNQEETTRFFQTTYQPSESTLEENKNLQRHRTNLRRLFPSLANDDYPILQESYPLLDRIWSELELKKCTYNTLAEETSRFGMRPCQATLDKDYCFALSQISQQHMLLELQVQVANAESILHETLSQYHELEILLVDVLRRKYNIPHEDNGDVSNLDLGQAPIKFPRRKLADFPWHDSVKQALEDVSNQITNACLVSFHPESSSIQMADDAVRHVFTAFGKRDDMDQQAFLKQRNRQAMIRVSQKQAKLKGLLEKIILAPTDWPGLPKLRSKVEMWYEISLQSKTSNTRRNPVPLMEFQTQLGQGCFTATQLMLMGGLLSTTVQVYDWVDIDVQMTPKHPLTKISILSNGKRIAGFNPIVSDGSLKGMEKLVRLMQILKQLQEA